MNTVNFVVTRANVYDYLSVIFFGGYNDQLGRCMTPESRYAAGLMKLLCQRKITSSAAYEKMSYMLSRCRERSEVCTCLR